MINKILFVNDEHYDAELLDAYSSTITGVVGSVAPLQLLIYRLKKK